MTKPETRISAFTIRLEQRVKKKAVDITDNDSFDDGDEDEEDDDEDRSLQGYAIVFDSDSEDLGGFVERVAPGALDASLRASAAGQANIYALWAHDWSQPLGSTAGGKLTVQRDAKGLFFNLDPSRMTPAQLDAANDGELRMSFGFQVNDDDWTERADGTVLRTLNDVTLLEVSPVAMPAYPDTSAAMRSLEKWRSGEKSEPEAKYSTRATRLSLLKRYAEHVINRRS